MLCDGRIEAGPEHPQVKSSYLEETSMRKPPKNIVKSRETMAPVGAQDYQSWRTGPSDTPSSSCVCSYLGWVGTRFGSPSDRSKLQRCEWSWSLQHLWSETELSTGWFNIEK